VELAPNETPTPAKIANPFDKLDDLLKRPDR
jgi:hypothetical protein